MPKGLVRWVGVVLIVLGSSATSRGQLSGQIGIDLISRRIPSTVTGEIKLDTPSEFTLLEFSVNSKLSLSLAMGCITPSVKASINTAGLESFIFSSPISFGDALFPLARVKALRIEPEIWVAVPFERVVDVNNLPNAVVIPPADPLFVSGRATLIGSIAGFDLEHLMMLEDTAFPSPNGSHVPLFYNRTDQEFDVGNLTTVHWRASMGLAMNMQIGLGASGSSKSVKGYSAKGSVTPGRSFLSLGFGGLPLTSVSAFGIGIQDVALGGAFSASTGADPVFATTLSVAGEAWDGTTLSFSVSLGALPPTVSTIRLSAINGPFTLALALDTLSIEGLSASCGDSLNLGPISGRWSVSATGIEKGLTGLSMSLALSEGVFSTNTSLTFSQRGDSFGFASWSSQLIFRFSPAVVSGQVTFGRYGLTQASVTTSVSF